MSVSGRYHEKKMDVEEKDKLLELGYTQDQIDEISQGEKAGLDVSVYADKDFLAIQMHQIRRGMMEGLPVQIYARKDYDWFQMGEIRQGLLDKVDVSLYASPDIPYDKMRQVRQGLMDGINLSGYLKLSAGVLGELRKALLSKVNITKYIKEGYNTEQLEQIRLSLEKGVDVSPYLSKELRGVSIREICEGLERGLDVSLYAKVEFSWQQMREIKLGLENRVNVGLYDGPFYSWQQMREIRLGLEEGLDVSSYCSLMYTAKEMKKRRLALQKNNFPEIPISDKPHIEKFDNFIISVSDDEMKAYIEIQSKGREVHRDEIIAALKQKGIRKGILEDQIDNLAKGEYEGRKVLIARGQPPENGSDGWYEYFFRTNVERTPKLLEDGSVDYQNIDWFEVVEQGQKIACYHDAEEGIPGYTVTGVKIAAKKGKEKSVLAGKGFMLMPDQRTYLSTVTGKIDLYDDRLEVTRLLIMEEVTLATGNVDFDGSVYVKGKVGSGTSIKAEGDILIDGYVESAGIECGGRVILRNGINASGNGYIRAAKGVSGRFFEAVRVYSMGDIQANTCMNCELYAEGKIIVCGINGTLVGGSAYAINGFRGGNVGNRAGLFTILKVGINEVVLKNQMDIEEKINKVNKELSILGNAYMDFQRKYPPEIRNTMEMYLKIESAIYTKEKQMEQLYQAKTQMEENIQKTKDARAIVGGILYDGVIMEINGLRWDARNVRNVTVKRAGNRIAVFAN